MLCLECGAEMRLVQVTKDTTMPVSGYEHHTWQCSGLLDSGAADDLHSREDADPNSAR